MFGNSDYVIRCVTWYSDYVIQRVTWYSVKHISRSAAINVSFAKCFKNASEESSYWTHPRLSPSDDETMRRNAGELGRRHSKEIRAELGFRHSIDYPGTVNSSRLALLPCRRSRSPEMTPEVASRSAVEMCCRGFPRQYLLDSYPVFTFPSLETLMSRSRLK